MLRDAEVEGKEEAEGSEAESEQGDRGRHHRVAEGWLHILTKINTFRDDVQPLRKPI